MEKKYVFPPTITGDGTGTSPLKKTPVTTVSVATRCGAVYCPALSTVCIFVAGGVTASVKVISNPFADAAKDKVLLTTAVSAEYVVASAQFIIVDVVSTDGAVSAIVVLNDD